MSFNKKLLHYFLEGALREYSEDFRVLEVTNPIKFVLNGIKYSVNISYVHDSGNTRPNPDEMRVQLSKSMRDKQKDNFESGYTVGFIGFYEGGEIFVGWKPEYIFSLKGQNSAYANESHIQTVTDYGAALRKRHSPNYGDYITVALPANALGLYLENISLFHQIEEEAELQGFLNNKPQFVDGSSKYSEERIEYDFTEQGKRERKTIVSKRVSYPRNPRFSKEVFAAYGGACAICSKQLGIVQAAHIIPHSHDDCVDRVTNGIALCVEHHALYDAALLMPDKSKKLFLNPTKIEFLKETGQENGLDELEERAKHEYTIPEDTRLHPSDDFLKKGVKIRLGQTA